MKLASLVLTLLVGVGATLALTMAPAPIYKPKHVNLVPTCERLESWWNLCTQVREGPFRREIHHRYPRIRHAGSSNR